MSQVKVFWGTQADRVQDVDNGAFAHWLQRAEQEQRLGADPAALVGSCQAQVCHAPSKYSSVECLLATAQGQDQQSQRVSLQPVCLTQYDICPMCEIRWCTQSLFACLAQPACLQVMVVGHEFKASSQTHNVAKVPSPSKAPAPQPQSSRIAIPAYRRLQPPKDPGTGVDVKHGPLERMLHPCSCINCNEALQHSRSATHLLWILFAARSSLRSICRVSSTHKGQARLFVCHKGPWYGLPSV